MTLAGMMKMIRRTMKNLPLHDIQFATAYCVVTITALWVFDHPTDEWRWIGLIGYVLLWTSRLLVVNLTVLGLRRLTNYGRSVANRAGVEIPEGAPEGSTQVVAPVVAFAFLIAMILVIFGLAVSLVVPVVAYFGLTPLAPGFWLAGLIALGVGGVVVALFFGWTLILFKRADAAVSSQTQARDSRIENAGMVASYIRIAVNRRNRLMNGLWLSRPLA